MKKKRILVTGAAGYIGKHVVNTLLNYDVDVIANDIFTDSINSNAEIIQFDIFSGKENIFEKLGYPDVCIHLAWRDGFIHNSDFHMEYLSKHYKFIKDMIDGGLKHIAVMGTMHEVGYFEGCIDENTPCNPINMYGISKDALRKSIMVLTKNTSIISQWLRAYYIYGDDENNNSIFAKLVKSEKEGKEKFPFTKGKNKYDFIHIERLAQMIVSVILQDKINGIINCCEGKPISLSSKVEDFIKEHNFKIKLDYGAFPERDYDSPEIWGNNGKINKILQQSKLLLEKNNGCEINGIGKWENK